MEKYREILFKAKALDSGMWVYGDLYHENDITYILFDGRKVEVDSSTICQYIGFSDKHNHKIFECDILETPLDKDTSTYCDVRWSDGRFELSQCGYTYEYRFDIMDFNSWSICGNIFDNPELLSKQW